MLKYIIQVLIAAGVICIGISIATGLLLLIISSFEDFFNMKNSEQK